MEQQAKDSTMSDGTSYAAAAQVLQQTFNSNMAAYGPHLFSTGKKGLSSRFVTAFGENHQQHNCDCCRTFVRRYGHTAFIDDAGFIIPALWAPDEAPEGFGPAFADLERTVRRGSVLGEFFTDRIEWGVGESGGFNHLHIQTSPVSAFLELKGVNDNNTYFKLLQKAVEEFPIEIAKRAANILRSDVIKKPRDFFAQADWFLGFHGRLQRADGDAGRIRNLIFKEVAQLEIKSYARIANTVIGNLMQDIKDGLHIDQITGRFNKLTAEGKYRVTTAAPTEGNVAVARKAFAELGLDERVLERRVATAAELKYLWRPAGAAAAEAKETSAKLFGDVVTKEKKAPTQSLSLDGVVEGGRITWDRFQAEILPRATDLAVRVASGNQLFAVYSAPVHEDAGRLYYYDSDEQRNGYSWFMPSREHRGQHVASKSAADFGLPTGLVRAVGISELPTTWYSRDPRNMEDFGLVVVLEGAEWGPSMNVNGRAIITSLLRPELREVRRVIEGTNETGKLAVPNDGRDIAVGLRLDAYMSAKVDLYLVVTDDLGRTSYIIDRLR